MFAMKPRESKNIQEKMMHKEMSFNRDQETMQMGNQGAEEMYLERREEKEDLTRWQQDMQNEIENTIHDLKREEQDVDGNWKSQLEFSGEYEGEGEDSKAIYNPMKPMMNDKGIAMFRSACRPLVSRNLMMSNYKDDMIYTKLRGIVFTFINHIAYNHHKYNIDKGDLSMIVRLFKDIIEPAHWRAWNQGERSYLNTIQKRIDAFSHGSPIQQKPKGIISSMLGGNV